MYDFKPWYKSTGIIGAIITLASVVLALLGLHVSNEDMALLSKELTTITGAVGGIMSLLGRLKATQGIGKPVQFDAVADVLSPIPVSPPPCMAGADCSQVPSVVPVVAAPQAHAVDTGPPAAPAVAPDPVPLPQPAVGA